MPKLKPEASDARRSAIIDAALRCFRARGFHQTSMKEICTEGGFSPGALYLYFDSKDALIEGLIEREMGRTQAILSDLRDRPGLIQTLVDLTGAMLMGAQVPGEMALTAEIFAEGLRNPRIRALLDRADAAARPIFTQALAAAQARGEIDADVDVAVAATVLFSISDGLVMRLAMDPGFDPERLLPTLQQLIERWLAPVQSIALPQRSTGSSATLLSIASVRPTATTSSSSPLTTQENRP
jgi:AcrR family transcriptional regulator